MAPFAQRTINIVCPQIVAKGLLIINDSNIFSPQNTRATNQDHYEKYQTFQLWFIDRRYLFIDELKTIFLHLNCKDDIEMLKYSTLRYFRKISIVNFNDIENIFN